jgi:2'-5' RNA ligase
MPSQSSQENITLQQHINSLSSHHPPSSTFHPHVTLMPTVPLTLNLEELTRSISAALQDWSSSRGSDKLTLEVQPPQTGDIYFQAIINPIKPSSSINSGLLDLRKRCEIAYDVHPPRYFPHLSLMYSELHKDDLENIVQELKTLESVEMPSQIDIQQVWIVKAEGSVDTWRPVSKLSLTGNQIT